MSTASARKGYELHRAVVQSADTLTGITQVKIPDLLGNQVVEVHWAGLEKVGGVYKTPNPGDMSLVAVSNDGTQIMWVLSADHSAIWDASELSDAAIAALSATVVIHTGQIATLIGDLSALDADVTALTGTVSAIGASVSTLNSTYVSTVTGTANEIAVSRTGASVGLSLPTDVVKSGTGYFRVTNTGASSTAASVSRVEMGVVTGAPRIVLEDSSNATVWSIDNFGGTLRMFNSGAEKYNFTNTALTTQGSIGIVAGGTVQGTRLISTIATGTAPLTVTSTTNVANLNADQLDGCHIVTSTTAPTVSTNPGFGTGSTHTATWMYIGATTTGAVGHLSLQGQITLGTSPTMGDTRITLPNSFTFANYVGPGTARCGTLGMRAASVGYSGFVRMESTTVGRFVAVNSGTTTQVYAQDTGLTTAIPATWVAGDSMIYNIQCQVVHP